MKARGLNIRFMDSTGTKIGQLKSTKSKMDQNPKYRDQYSIILLYLGKLYKIAPDLLSNPKFVPLFFKVLNFTVNVLKFSIRFFV